MKTIFPIFFICLLCLSCRDSGHGNESQANDAGTITEAPAPTDSQTKNPSAPSGKPFIDTLINGDTFTIAFDKDTVVLKFNTSITRIPLICDHDFRRGIVMHTGGQQDNTNFLFTNSTGIVAFLNYDDPFARCQFFMFRIKNHQLVLLDYNKDKIISAAMPAIHEKDDIYFVGNGQLLLLNYHSTREKKIPYYDSFGKRAGNIDSDERYYNFSRLDLGNSSVLSFDIAGTGNEFAIDQDFEVMINKAVNYRKNR